MLMSSALRQKESHLRRGGGPADAPRAQRARASRPLLALACALLLLCASARAQNPGPSPSPTPEDASAQESKPCKAPQGKSLGAAGVFKCLKHYYDRVTPRQGFHLVTGSVAPGAGLTGGLGYSKQWDHEAGQTLFDASGRISVRKYWELDANLRLNRGENRTDVERGDTKINFYALVKDMPRLDFFGVGPETREEDRAVYHYREGVAGADLSKPVAGWLNVGGALESVWPDIVRISNPTVNSVERAFGEASAPGITRQPSFFHYVAYAGLHTPGQIEHRRVDYQLFYHFYQDWQEHRFSFRRFDADLRNKFPVGGTTRTKDGTTYNKNELRVRLRLSLSETREGQRVPFYLMPTLGGSNLRGEDTLRGFRDYRFRDRDLVLLQAEYLRELKGPLDFIAFYDTGKVAPSVSRFDEGRLRHTYGLGVVVVPRRLGDIFFRLYVALGSGEGSHTYFGGGLPGRADRLVR